MSISKRKRFELFKRDRFTCQYCGGTPPSVILELDHIIPRSRGGDDSIVNLVTSCEDCNRGKSDVPLDAVIPGMERVISEGQERLAQLKAYNRLIKAEEREMSKAVDRVRRALGLDDIVDAEGGSIRLFLKRLPLHEVIEAADIAVSRKGQSSANVLWKYFCGVCWMKIKHESQED